jgi:hypothetical protein
MILNEQQIERYSRQIIVPRVGGRAQERLLRAHVVIVAEACDAEMAYLTGAGVGRTTIHPVNEPALYKRMVERTRDLNPEVVATVENGVRSSNASAPPAPNLVLALINNARSVKAAESLCRSYNGSPSVIARLDALARVAVMPTPPPCALCADADLWSTPDGRGANSGVAAMLALVEAFKVLAGFDEHPTPRLFEFTGYSTTPRALRPRADATRCECRTQ